MVGAEQNVCPKLHFYDAVPVFNKGHIIALFFKMHMCSCVCERVHHCNLSVYVGGGGKQISNPWFNPSSPL